MKNIFDAIRNLRDRHQQSNAVDFEVQVDVLGDLIDIVGALAAMVEEMQLASGFQGLPEESKPEKPGQAKHDPEQVAGKFTPGPWRYVSPGEVHAADGKVANVYFHIARGVYVAEADAKLIAAAPEMLAVLEAAMRIESLWAPDRDDDGDPDECQALANMRRTFIAAIAKAKGESVE